MRIFACRQHGFLVEMSTGNTLVGKYEYKFQASVKCRTQISWQIKMRIKTCPCDTFTTNYT